MQNEDLKKQILEQTLLIWKLEEKVNEFKEEIGIAEEKKMLNSLRAKLNKVTNAQ